MDTTTCIRIAATVLGLVIVGIIIWRRNKRAAE